jgi:hypothetical protein
MVRRIKITSESWLNSIREHGGNFHVRVSMNVLGCCKFVEGVGAFIGEPPTGVDVKEKPEDYFEVIPIDSEGSVIEGVYGLMHSAVLEYMKKVNPDEEGNYLMHANAGINSGRMKYSLSETDDVIIRGERQLMKKIEIFDPAMCCSTGLCGTAYDPELLRVATVISALQKNGADITRHNPASDPRAFADNKLVSSILAKDGADILPIVLVDGEAVKKGEYPTNEEFSAWAGQEISEGERCCGDEDDDESCCCSEDCC